MKKFKLQNILDSKQLTAVLSFVIAVALWVIVVTLFSTEAKNVIRNVPINTNYNATYRNLGLEIIDQDIETVDVTVTGPRNIIGNLTASDIIVYPSFSVVNVQGRYDLALNAVKTSTIMDYQIESLSTYQISARFASVVEKTFPIEIDISGITVPDGYMIDKTYSTPENVTIKGPENTVNLIDKVVATVEKGEIAQTVILEANLTMYDMTGTEVDSKYFTYDQDEYTVTIPILKEMEVPVKVELLNVPDGFATSTFDFVLSHQRVKIAVPTRGSENMTELIAGYVDLKTLAFETPYIFDMTSQSGYKFLDDITEISATFSEEGIGRKNITVSNITVVNKGDREVEVLTEIINNVELVGDAEAVEEITGDKVVAEIDMNKVSLAQGQQTVEVEIIIPGVNNIYARGTYHATIKN